MVGVVLLPGKVGPSRLAQDYLRALKGKRTRDLREADVVADFDADLAYGRVEDLVPVPAGIMEQPLAERQMHLPVLPHIAFGPHEHHRVVGDVGAILVPFRHPPADVDPLLPGKLHEFLGARPGGDMLGDLADIALVVATNHVHALRAYARQAFLGEKNELGALPRGVACERLHLRQVGILASRVRFHGNGSYLGHRLSPPLVGASNSNRM